MNDNEDTSIRDTPVVDVLLAQLGGRIYELDHLLLTLTQLKRRVIPTEPDSEAASNDFPANKFIATSYTEQLSDMNDKLQAYNARFKSILGDLEKYL